jgi:hypothetical protein
LDRNGQDSETERAAQRLKHILWVRRRDLRAWVTRKWMKKRRRRNIEGEDLRHLSRYR